MGTRLQFQTILEDILGVPPNSKKVFFQPPNGTMMDYSDPGVIIYRWDDEDLKHADDISYNRTRRYQVTYIGHDPDSAIPDKIAALPYSRFDRSFAAENLNHTVYNVFF